MFIDKLKNIKLHLLIPVLLGVIIGWSLYGFINYRMHQWHHDALSNVKAQHILIDENDVALHSLFFLEKDNEGLQLDDMTYRISKSFGLIQKDDEYADIASTVRAGFKGNETLITSRDDLMQESAASLVTNFLSAMGAVPEYQKGHETEAEEILIRLIGRLPSSLNNYNKVLNDTTYEGIKHKGYFLSYFNPFIPTETISNQDILQRLMTQYRLTDSFLPVYDVTRKQSTGQASAEDQKLLPEFEYEQSKEFLNRLLFNWLTAHHVTYTRDWVMVFRGPLQLLMFMLFFTAITILFFPVGKLVGKGKSLSEEEKAEMEEQRSEIFIFCEETMPVLGFIGTILGLMLALGDAYKIPIATAGTGSALAISAITNTLAMAFTTTLMAFVLKIILDLIKLISKSSFDFVTKKEHSLIDTLTLRLGKLISKPNE